MRRYPPLAWRYVNTLLLNADARALGFEKFSAPDIFSIRGSLLFMGLTGHRKPVCRQL